MMRFRMGLGISIFIIILMVISNSHNSIIINPSRVSNSDESNETNTLLDSSPTEGLDIIIDPINDKTIPETNELHLSMKHKSFSNSQPEIQEYEQIENKQDLSSITTNENSNNEADLNIDLLMKQKDPEPNLQHSQYNGNSNLVQKVTTNSIDKKTNEPTTVTKTTGSKSLYENDIAGGSWVDTFTDNSGINLTTSDNLNLINGDIKIKISPLESFKADKYTVGLWHLDEGTGTKTKDASSNKNDGTLKRSPTWTSGRFNNALDFSGGGQWNSAGDYVDVPHSTNLNLNGNFTIEAWIKSKGTQKYDCIVDKYSGSNTASYGYTFYLSGGRLRLSIYSGTKTGDIYGKSNLHDNKWHYVVGVFNGTHTSLYVDCKLENSKIYSSPSKSTSNNLAIGYRISGWGGYLPFEGIIDEVRISNIARPPLKYANLTTKTINLPKDMNWDTLIINKTWPENTELIVSLLDALTDNPIPQFKKIYLNGELDISNLDPTKYPTIKLKAELIGTRCGHTPVLHYWGVNWNATNAWRDTLFGGLHVISSNLNYGDGEIWLKTSPYKYFKISNNPLLKKGSGTSWDNKGVAASSIIFNGSVYMMWYEGRSSSKWEIGLATSFDGISWTKYCGNPVLTIGSSSSWEGYLIGSPCVLFDGSEYKMWYEGKRNGYNWKIGYATSNDGITWKKYSKNPVLDIGKSGFWDDNDVGNPCVYYDGYIYKMWFTGRDSTNNYKSGYATSFDGINWKKYQNNPILTGPNGGDKGALDLFVMPLKESRYLGWYGNDFGSYSVINLITSNDGVTWTKYSNNPILTKSASSSWDDTSVTFPEIMIKDKQYYLFYGGTDGSNVQLGMAKSKITPFGSLNSTNITVPKYNVFDQLIINKTETTGNYINISIIDTKTNKIIAGFNEIRNNIFNISTLNELGYSSIRLIANFSSNQKATPILFNWAVTWRPLPKLEVNASGPYLGFEGFPVQVKAKSGTHDYLLKFEYRWDLDNDSVFDTSWSDLPVLNNTWYDDHIGTLAVQLRDNYNRISKSEAKVFISNVSPTVSAGLDQTINEGETAYFKGFYFDPGKLDTHTIKWNFDDDSSNLSSVNTSHKFDHPGLYNVTLEIRDDDGGVGTDNLTLTVLNLIPIADAGSDISIDEAEKFSFNGSIKNPGKENITFYWDFDIITDGLDVDNITDNDADSTLLKASHIFMNNATYTAKLTVRDDDNSTAWDFVNITVYDLVPIADAGTDHWVYSNKNITFNASGSYSYPDEIIYYHWNFGDGTNSTGLLVNHSFLKYGIYHVKLTVTDDDGSIDQDISIVYVNESIHWCGYIAYEDLKNQNWCDYDYNDWGMLMQVKSDYQYDGNLSWLEIEFVGMLKLAGYDHSIHLGIGIYSNTSYNWSAWHFDKTDKMFWNESGAKLGDLNITLFNCTDKNVGYSTVVRLEFEKPVNPSDIAEIPFDPYMYVFNTKEEIHVDDNQIMSIKDAKGSNPFIGQNETPLVLVAELCDWTPPNECQRIWKAYPYFDDWIFSKRTKYLDWYLYPS